MWWESFLESLRRRLLLNVVFRLLLKFCLLLKSLMSKSSRVSCTFESSYSSPLTVDLALLRLTAALLGPCMNVISMTCICFLTVHPSKRFTYSNLESLALSEYRLLHFSNR